VPIREDPLRSVTAALPAGCSVRMRDRRQLPIPRRQWGLHQAAGDESWDSGMRRVSACPFGEDARVCQKQGVPSVLFRRLFCSWKNLELPNLYACGQMAVPSDDAW